MLSLVVPVYRNEESIPELLDVLTTIHGHVADGLEVVVVVDGSPDRSYGSCSVSCRIAVPFPSRSAVAEFRLLRCDPGRAGAGRGQPLRCHGCRPAGAT